ncbi:MAG TPA: prepilin-type N-terminal cleavage/methylation domain-containing protein [Parvularculaceae bacterium]|nr:prepilin-type N-terminal cleavage/methylation domain-containing protein [Parvularculaceae bacterium]
MNNRAAQNRGYSLVEALIATAILAGLAAAAAPAIHSSIRASTRLAADARGAEESRIGYDSLAGLFQRAIDDGVRGTPAFQGDSKSLSFFAAEDLEKPADNIRLSIEGGDLIYRAREGTRPIVLLKDAQAFRYYGGPENASPAWRDEWTEKEPPLLVEVTRQETEPALPLLSFFIAARAPLNCAFDQVSRKCRS